MDKESLKSLLKEALIELLEERPELFYPYLSEIPPSIPHSDALLSSSNEEIPIFNDIIGEA